MAKPSLLPFDGARYMFVGASVTTPYRWSSYFAAYFSLRYPQYNLYYAMDAASGSSMKRMFSNDEFGWDTESPIADYHVHARTVSPWQADFVFVQHALAGGFSPANDALQRKSYIDNYLTPEGMVPVIINGWCANSPWATNDQNLLEETAINDLALSEDPQWNSSVIYMTTADNWGTEYVYTANASTNLFTAVGHPFTDGTRVRIAKVGGSSAHPAPITNEIDFEAADYYVRDVSGDTFRLALTEGGSAIDLTTAHTGDVRLSHKWALGNGHDDSHPGTPKYMVLFKYMMDSLGMDTSVSQATINASAATVTSQTQCTISGVTVNAQNGVNFNRLDNRLPYVLDADWWEDAIELEPDLLTHQDYSMTVTGLGAGEYNILCDGVTIGTATHEELAAGWNMSALQVGPVFEKAQEVLWRIRDAQGLERYNHNKQADLALLGTAGSRSGFVKYKGTATTSYNTTGNRGTAHFNALATDRASHDALCALIKTAAQPETLAFSIQKASPSIEWDAPETPPASAGVTVTAYEVWEETSPGTWALSQTLPASQTWASVGAGKYSVRAVWSGGRTALSDPVETDSWLQNLPTPDGSNTVNNGMTKAAIQAVLDAADPGGVIYFSGGTYSHAGSGVYLNLGAGRTVHGTAGNLITIMPLPGATVVLQGSGWSDETAGPAADQELVRISGDYWRAYGFEVKDSGQLGINAYGNYGEVLNNHTHHNWGTGILLGNNDTAPWYDITGIKVEDNISHHNVRGNGIGIALRKWSESGTPDYRVDNPVMRRNISYANGFDADGVLNVFGGGNSDGFVVSKDAHVNVTDVNPSQGINIDRYTHGNRVLGVALEQNIFYRNADDGVDINCGEGTRVVGNIEFHNFGDTGSAHKGIKNFNDHFGAHTYVGELMLSSIRNLVPTGQLYFDGGEIEITIGDVIVGHPSGATATVDEAKHFLNDGGEWATGTARGVLEISGITGIFEDNDEIRVGGVRHATAGVPRQGTGFEPRSAVNLDSVAFDAGGTTPIVVGNTITGGTSGETAVVDKISIYSGSWAAGNAVGVLICTSQTGEFLNNESLLVSAANRATVRAFPDGSTRYTRGATISSNITELYHPTSWPGSDSDDLEVEDIDTPSGYYNLSYDEPTETLTGNSNQEKWRTLYREIHGNLMPTSGSALRDAVTLNTAVHHATAADHATTPSAPDDLTKLAWFGTRPDQGAVQYQTLFAPVVSVVSGTSSAPDPAPGNLTPPSITGTPIQGTQVTSSAGSWSGAVSYAYQWVRTTGSVVVGTSINYTPVLADVGSTLTFRVTAFNATGSTERTTAASASVEAAAVTPPPPSSSGTGKRSQAHVSRIIAATI